MKIAILIPAYNEALCIQEVISRFHQALPEALIVVIDNRSTDETAALASESLKKLNEKGRLITEKRPGKGSAIRRAFIEIEADIYIMVDADLTYSEADLPQLLLPVQNGETDIVVGDRISSGDYAKTNHRHFHGIGNQIVTRLINGLFGSNLKDIMSGYRVFNRQFVRACPILYQGFELETELTVHALHHRFRILEIPISYAIRGEGSTSKLNTYRDGFRVIRTIFDLLKDYRPFLFFGVLAIIACSASIVIGFPVVHEYIQTAYVKKVPSAILACGLMIISVLLVAIGLVLDTVSKNQRSWIELWIRAGGSHKSIDS